MHVLSRSSVLTRNGFRPLNKKRRHAVSRLERLKKQQRQIKAVMLRTFPGSVVKDGRLVSPYVYGYQSDPTLPNYGKWVRKQPMYDFV